MYLLLLFNCTCWYYLKQAEADCAMGRFSVAPKYLNRVVFWGQRTVSSTERRVLLYGHHPVTGEKNIYRFNSAL